MEGWIRIHRKIIDHWVYKDDRYFKAWVKILMTVNYEPKKVLIEGELIDCGRGQSVLSLKSWAEAFGKGWSIQTVRTFFSLLKNDMMIDTEGLRKTTRLTVCNYDQYQNVQQGDNTENNRQPTDSQHGDNTETTSTKEEIKKDKKEEKKEEKKEKEKNSNSFFSEEELESAKPEEGITLPDPEEKVKEMEEFMKMLMQG